MYFKFKTPFLVCKKNTKEVYTKYVGGGGGGVGRILKFFKKVFTAQETIDVNISWPSDFFKKYFMVPPTKISFLFKAFL